MVSRARPAGRSPRQRPLLMSHVAGCAPRPARNPQQASRRALRDSRSALPSPSHHTAEAPQNTACFSQQVAPDMQCPANIRQSVAECRHHAAPVMQPTAPRIRSHRRFKTTKYGPFPKIPATPPPDRPFFQSLEKSATRTSNHWKSAVCGKTPGNGPKSENSRSRNYRELLKNAS